MWWWNLAWGFVGWRIQNNTRHFCLASPGLSLKVHSWHFTDYHMVTFMIHFPQNISWPIFNGTVDFSNTWFDIFVYKVNLVPARPWRQTNIYHHENSRAMSTKNVTSPDWGIQVESQNKVWKFSLVVSDCLALWFFAVN